MSHTVLPVAFVYWPMAQSRQYACELVATYFPTTHLSQETAPAAWETEPAPQFRHVVLPVELWYVPARQSAQASISSKAVNLPAAHGKKPIFVSTAKRIEMWLIQLTTFRRK